MESREGGGHAAIKVGGWSFIAAAVGFMAVFGYLAATFNYPEVLDGSADQVLPKLLTLGPSGRAVWAVYALLPFLLIPAALGARNALERFAPTRTRAALICAVITAVAMFLGLARWPSVHWELARAYGSAGAESRAAIDPMFLGLNVYLGNWIGEFVGEMALSTFFVLVGSAALRSTAARWFGYGGIIAGVIGYVAAFRNVTGAVSFVADVDNYVLPLWLIVLGVVFIRWKAASVVDSGISIPADASIPSREFPSTHASR